MLPSHSALALPSSPSLALISSHPLQIALVSDVDALDDQGRATHRDRAAVQLSTIHGAKVDALPLIRNSPHSHAHS